MTRTLILEDFGHASDPSLTERETADGAAPVAPPDAAHPDSGASGLEAFEQGYQSGWDDCIANETEERRRIGTDLAAALSELSLTTETIRTELLTSISPVLEEIASQLLPKLAAEAVAPILINEVTNIVSGHGPVTLELFAAPEKCASIAALVETVADLPVTVVPETAFAEGQVSIRFADQRRDIDLSDAAARMSAILRAFAADAGSAGPQTGHGSDDIERGVA
jgi:hypothetical protein